MKKYYEEPKAEVILLDNVIATEDDPGFEPGTQSQGGGD